MPVFVSPVQNAYRAIDKPCVDQVIRQLIDTGYIPKPDIYVNNDNLFSSNRIVTSTIRYPGQLSMVVETQLEMVEQADWALKNRWQYMPVLFMDNEIPVELYPMLVDYQASLRMVYADDDLELLRRLRESLLVRRNMGWYGSEHVLDSTLIPSVDTDELLRSIHSLREARYGYGHTYEEWMALCATPDYHPIAGGRHVEQVFNFRQTRIEGFMEGDIAEIEEYNTGVFSLAVSYRFRYARPTSIIARYPIQVHQQLLPKKFTLTVNQEHRGYAIAEVASVKAITQVSDVYPPSIRIPSVDLVPMRQLPAGYLPIWTALLSLDDTPIASQVLCTIDQIPDVVMHPSIISFLKGGGHTTLATSFQNPFFIALYQDDQLMDPRYLTVDSDLNVRLTTDVNKRKIYRLAFCIIQQLSGLSATALPAIGTYGLGEIISDTINLLASRFDTKVLGNEIVLPKDLTSVGYLRTISPIVTGWTETGEPYLTRNPRGIVTQRTVMDTWVTVVRK